MTPLHTLFISLAAVAIFGLMASCQTKSALAAEQTRQEAFKAGYVQGEFGYWKKP